MSSTRRKMVASNKATARNAKEAKNAKDEIQKRFTDWKELNLTLPFARFCQDIFGMPVDEKIARLLLDALKVDPHSLAIPPLANLLAMLAHDLGDVFDPFIGESIASLVSILLQSQDIQTIETVIQTIFWLFKWRETSIASQHEALFHACLAQPLATCKSMHQRHFLAQLWAQAVRKCGLRLAYLQTFGATGEMALDSAAIVLTEAILIKAGWVSQQLLQAAMSQTSGELKSRVLLNLLRHCPDSSHEMIWRAYLAHLEEARLINLAEQGVSVPLGLLLETNCSCLSQLLPYWTAADLLPHRQSLRSRLDGSASLAVMQHHPELHEMLIGPLEPILESMDAAGRLKLLSHHPNPAKFTHLLPPAPEDEPLFLDYLRIKAHAKLDLQVDLMRLEARLDGSPFVTEALRIMNKAGLKPIDETKYLPWLPQLSWMLPGPLDLELIIPLLISGNHAQRQEGLRLCTASSSLAALKEIEAIPWTFTCDRDKSLLLQRLLPADDWKLVTAYLIGLISTGFVPLQASITRTLERFVQEDKRAWISRLFEAALLADPEKTVLPLLSSLVKSPALTEVVQGTLAQLLERVFEQHATSSLSSAMQRHLGLALQALSAIPVDSHALESMALRFMAFGDAKIQLPALLLYLSMHPAISSWRERLEQLTSDNQKMKDALIELTAEQASIQQAPEWPQLLPVMIRLLYGRLIARHGVAAGKSSMEVRRKQILNYLSTWTPEDLSQFISFIMPKEESKWTGYLNLLEFVLAKLGRKVDPQVIIDSVLAAISDSKLHRLALRRLEQSFTCLDDLTAFKERVLLALESRLSSLATHYAHEQSALLDLISVWSQDSRYRSWIPNGQVIQLLEVASPSLQEQVLSILGQLQLDDDEVTQLVRVIHGKLQTEGTVGEDEVPMSARHLQRINAPLIQLLLQVVRGNDVKIIGELAQTLLTLLGNRLLPREDDQVACLLIMERMAISADLWEPLSGLLGWLKSPVARQAVCRLLSAIGNSEVTNLLTEMHAMDPKLLGEPDYGRRLAAMTRARSIPVEAVQPLLPLLHHLLWCLYADPEELSIRNQASLVLGTWIDGHASPLKDVLYAAILQGLRSPVELVRAEHWMLLGRLVKALPMSYPSLQPLLMGDDEEANIFANLFHIQIHRRSRAIRRLATFEYPAEVIEQIMLPLLLHCLQGDGRSPCPPVMIPDIVQTHASLVAQLPWNRIPPLTGKLLAVSKREGMPLKAILKMIPAMIEAKLATQQPVDEEPVATRLIDQLLKALKVKSPKQEQEEAELDPQRLPLAQAAARLAALLSPDHPVLIKLIIDLLHLLRHRELEVREAVRITLQSMPCTDRILAEARLILTRGPQRHGLVELCYCLLKKDQTPISCHQQVLTLALDAAVGSLAQERSSSDWTGKQKEATVNRGPDLIRMLVARVGMEGFMSMILEPVQAAATRDPEAMKPIYKAMEQGLEGYEECLILVHQLITQSVDDWQAKLMALHLLQGRIRQSSPSMLLPFVPLVSELILIHGHGSVQSAAIRSLAALLNTGLELPSELAIRIIARLFELVVKVVGSGDVVAACYKLITLLLRTHPDAQLSESQLRALLGFAREHLEAGNQQAMAFGLVRQLMSRGVILLELVDLMETIRRLVLSSPSDSTRQQSRAAYAQWVMHTQLGEEKREEHCLWIGKNLGYEEASGRLSMCELMIMLIAKVTPSIAETWWLALAQRLGQEEVERVREELQLAARHLFKHADESLQSKLSSLCLKWIESDKRAVKLIGWQMTSAVLQERANLIAPHLSFDTTVSDVPNLKAQLTAMLQMSEEYAVNVDLKPLMLHEALPIRHLVNQLLLMRAPESDHLAFHIKQLVDLPADQDEQAECIVRCLLRHSSEEHLYRLESTIKHTPGAHQLIMATLKLYAAHFTDTGALLLPMVSLCHRIISDETATYNAAQREMAMEFQSLLQTHEGFTEAWEQCSQTARARRHARRQEQATLKVTDPARWIDRKASKNKRKQEQRKEKIKKRKMSRHQ